MLALLEAEPEQTCSCFIADNKKSVMIVFGVEIQ